MPHMTQLSLARLLLILSFHSLPTFSAPRRSKEGKFSFPIIHCVRAKPNDHRLLNILKQRTYDVDVKKHALQWMEQTVRGQGGRHGGRKA